MKLFKLFEPWRGGGTLPPRQPIGRMMRAGAGSVTALMFVGLIAGATDLPLILGSFGATCLLVFGYPESPFSQPRSVMGGHLLSSAIGLLVLHGIGDGPTCLALAAGLAIASMMALRIVHPPAGSNPIIIFLVHAPWSFLLLPTTIGAALIIVCALLWHRATLRGAYPTFW